MARDLGNHGGNALFQLEVPFLHKEAAHAPKIDGRKKVFNIEVKEVAPMAMLAGVGNDRPSALETVGDAVLAVFLFVDLFDAVLKQFREPALHQLQSVDGRLYGSLSAVAL